MIIESFVMSNGGQKNLRQRVFAPSRNLQQNTLTMIHRTQSTLARHSETPGFYFRFAASALCRPSIKKRETQVLWLPAKSTPRLDEDVLAKNVNRPFLALSGPRFCLGSAVVVPSVVTLLF